MGERARRTIRWVTSLLMVLVVAAVVMLAVERSRRLRPAVVRLASEATGAGGQADGRAVGVSQGFEYTESVSGKTLFIMKAARTLGLTSGWTHIENVQFRWFGEDESAVELSCDSARFNPQTRDAELNGAVHVRLPGGAFLDMARGHFDASTQSVRSDVRVLFSNGETAGEAGRAVYMLSTGKLLLDGGVVVRERSGRSLEAPKVVYNRKSGWADFPGGLRISASSMVVRAPRARVRIDEDGGSPREIELEGGVQMGSPDLPRGGSFSGWAERLRGTRDAGGRWQVVASTSGPWVRLELVGTPDALLRRLETWRLRAVIGEDGPVKAVFESRLCVEDVPRQAMPRWAAATGGQLWFEDGEPAGFEMEGEVWLRAERYTVTADTARFLDRQERVVFSSDPAQRHRATVRSDGFTVSAERVEGLRNEEALHLEGEVQGVVEQAVLPGAREGQQRQGPVRLAADHLDIGDSGKRAVLRGGARVWQGDRLLLADEVTLQRAGERLEAAGNIRFTLPARQFNPDAPESKEALIIAQSLVYDRGMGILDVRGNVHYSDPLYLMACSALKATIGREHKVEVVDAQGNVDIQDLVEHRHMQGEKAHYEAHSGILEMTGRPVRLLDSSNNLITGSSLTWNRATGTVSVSGGEGSPTETIYHPEGLN